MVPFDSLGTVPINYLYGSIILYHFGDKYSLNLAKVDNAFLYSRTTVYGANIVPCAHCRRW